MIYLEHSICVPKVCSGSPAKLKLCNQTTHEQYNLNVTDEANNTTYYYFEIATSNIKDGQYDYEVLDSNNAILSTGIAQKGEFNATVSEYNHEKTIIQYEQ